MQDVNSKRSKARPKIEYRNNATRPAKVKRNGQNITLIGCNLKTFSSVSGKFIDISLDLNKIRTTGENRI